MVCTALILLSGRYGPIVVIPTCVILARELSISALREWMAQKGLRDIVQVGYQGKVKTALTMISLTLLLLVPHHVKASILSSSSSSPIYYSFIWNVSICLLQLCAAITVTSGSVYVRAALPYLLQAEK
jgi:phosphatidylglycerophosphate synthase